MSASYLSIIDLDTKPCHEVYFEVYFEVDPPMRSRLPTGGHMNRDKALAFQSPLTSRINLSSLFLNTFISLDTTTSSGREFHGSTTRDVKLFLHTSRIFLFLYNFLLFFLPGLSANVRKSDGYTSFLSLLSINILKT